MLTTIKFTTVAKAQQCIIEHNNIRYLSGKFQKPEISTSTVWNFQKSNIYRLVDKMPQNFQVIL